MIYKYLSKLKPYFGAYQKKMFTVPQITHSFSVVGHQTFGHFLTDADPVMAQLQNLNKYFAQNSHADEGPIQQFITSILRSQTLETIGNKVKIEVTSKREFNIFEVIAYCLFIELQQEFKNTKISVKIKDQIYLVKRENYFTYFQKFLDELKRIEENRLKQTVTILPMLKNHILDCQMKFAKKQIYRRLYQMCTYSAEQQILKQNYNDLKVMLRAFIKKIDLEYSRMSLDLINGFYQDFWDKQNHIYCKIYSETYSQKYYHPFIAEEIKALFADKIEQGYYSPLLILQDRYKAGLGFQKNDYIQKQPPLVHTFSFIPTFVTKALNNWMSQITANIFVSALKELGKSSNLLLLTILRGYTDLPKFVLIPQFVFEKMMTHNSLHMCIVQTLWKSLSKQNFIKVELQYKEIMKKSQKQTGNSSTPNYTFYKQAIQELLNIIKGNTRGLLLDQFSTFVGGLYKNDQQKNIQQQNEKIQLEFIFNLFDFAYKIKGYSVICCSSRAYQQEIIARKLNIMKQSVNLKTISKSFAGKQSNHLFMIWLKRHLQCLIYQGRLNKEARQIELLNQMTQQQQIVWQRKFENLQNVKSKLEIISKLTNENTKIIQGQMSVLKKSAQKIIIKLVQNPGIQINEESINAIQIEQKVKYYAKLIENWLKNSEKNKQQLLKRKQIIRAVLKGKSLDKLQFLYANINQQLPKFLFLQNQKIIKAELFQIMQQLWSQVKQLCALQENEWKSLFKLILKHKYQAGAESGIGFLIQLYIYDVFEQEKNIEEGCLLKEIFRIIYPTLPQDQRLNIKKFNIKKVIQQKNGFQQIAKQIDYKLKKYTGQNSFFMVPLSANFSKCDQYLIKLKNKNEKDQLQTKEASAIHIEIGVNKTKAMLEQLVFNVLSKQENCQNYVNKQFNKKIKQNKQYALENEQTIKNQLKNFFLKNHKQIKQFKNKMQKEFKSKGIALKSYDILLITGHKANQLGIQWKNQHNIKVINFKNLSSQSSTVKCVKNLFDFYEQLLLKKEQEKKQEKKKEKQEKQKQKQEKKNEKQQENKQEKQKEKQQENKQEKKNEKQQENKQEKQKEKQQENKQEKKNEKQQENKQEKKKEKQEKKRKGKENGNGKGKGKKKEKERQSQSKENQDKKSAE